MQTSMAHSLEGLGFACERIPHPANEFAPFLKAELQGEVKEYITLICHTDTVLPSSGFKLSEDNTVAYGSGVIDNKGGLVVMMSALKKFLSTQGRPRLSLRVLCSPNEEVGSKGFIPVYTAHSSDNRFVLGMEPALSNGSLIAQRRGNRWYDIDIVGREAHAGRSRGLHANAAHEFAKKVTQLSKLNNLKREMAVNVGYVHGGQDRHNIICGKLHAKLDVRFSTLKDRDWLHKKINSILGHTFEISADKKFRAQTSYNIVDDCPPIAPTRRALKLSQAYIDIIARLEGRAIKTEAAGGAGDVNYLSRRGVIVLDGFGPVGNEMHTKHECVEVKTLGTRSMALAHFLAHIQAGTV